MSASIVTHTAIPHLTTQVSEVIRIPDICSGIFVVWGGLTALVLCIWKFVRGFVLPEGLVAWFYAVNLLQWVVIPQKRLVYYYYYPPAMFLGVAIVIALNRANSPRVFGIRLSVLILVAAAVFFSLLLPSHDGVGSTIRLHVGLLVVRIPRGQNARKPNGSVPKWERYRFPK